MLDYRRDTVGNISQLYEQRHFTDFSGWLDHLYSESS